MLFTVTGITNKTLRVLMTGLLHRPYSMNQASYDLSRLASNGLIARVPDTQPLHPHPPTGCCSPPSTPGSGTTSSAR